MAKILSQEEVDSLLKGIDEGKIGTKGKVGEDGKDLPRYDFRNEPSPVHNRMPGLSIVMERFAGLLGASLSAASGAQIDADPPEISSMAFGDFCRAIPLPASLNLFKIEPLRGVSMLVIEGALVFAFVDLFLGGKAERQVKLEGKSFTPIELRIIEKIVRMSLENLEQALSEVEKLHMVFLRSGTDPQFAEIARPDDVMLISKVTLELGKFKGQMTLCTSFSTLEPVRGKLRGGFRGETLGVDEMWRKTLAKKIGELKVNVSCSFGHSRITGRELLKMKVDDVIVLDQRPEDPVIVRVEGIPKFTGYLGALRQNKAIRIDGRLNRE
jgi:flagellar motor switch protein FliM